MTMITELEEDRTMPETLVCPACKEPNVLTAVDRNGVVIDACPRCRGVWLDRGELDKLIELESASDEDFLAEMRGSSAGPEPDRLGSSGHHGPGRHGSGKHGSKTGAHGRKKRSLGDFFDFG
jgi:Zn-finger nucleic acid-binding protein